MAFRVMYEEETEARFAIYWSVPYDYLWAHNWFGLKFLDRSEKADKTLYDNGVDHAHWNYDTARADKQFRYVNLSEKSFYTQ